MVIYSKPLAVIMVEGLPLQNVFIPLAWNLNETFFIWCLKWPQMTACTVIMFHFNCRLIEVNKLVWTRGMIVCLHFLFFFLSLWSPSFTFLCFWNSRTSFILFYEHKWLQQSSTNKDLPRTSVTLYVMVGKLVNPKCITLSSRGIRKYTQRVIITSSVLQTVTNYSWADNMSTSLKHGC